MQIIRKNFGLKLLAVALAIVGWAYFRFASNPIVAAARFDQQISVPISAVNVSVGYVAHFSDKQAVVTVETNRGALPVKPDEVKAVLDLSNKGAGVYNVPIQLVAPDIAVQSLSPASVTLTIERIEQRAFSVAFHYRGTARSSIVVGDARVRPAGVIVNGPSTLLSQVAAVRVDVMLPNAPKMVDEMIRPVPVSALGVEIPGLDVAPDLVRVQIHFVPGAGTSTQR